LQKCFEDRLPAATGASDRRFYRLVLLRRQKILTVMRRHDRELDFPK